MFGCFFVGFLSVGNVFAGINRTWGIRRVFNRISGFFSVSFLDFFKMRSN